MKHIVQYNRFLTNPPRRDAAVWSLLSNDPITAHPEPQEHLFNKKLTVCRTYSQEATYVPSSLRMVYAFMFTSVALSSLFNFTSCFRVREIYFTTLTCHFFCHTVFRFAEFHGHYSFLLSHSAVWGIFIYF